MTPQEKISVCIPELLTWFYQNQKSLPWRKDPEPYHIWLSEIMLQQTRVEAVIPYYQRFLQYFPTVQALANAEDDLLMKCWQGLGYYSRAKNLKKAARIIVDRYGGKLPETVEELIKLPGIGSYTAGAIASIAYFQPTPAVDGNVLRVYMRVLGEYSDITDQKVKTGVERVLKEIYPTGQNAAGLTEGLMELGQTVCIPNGAPLCEHCPIRAYCEAYSNHLTDILPVRTPKKERKQEKLTVFILNHHNTYALRRRPERGLLAGLWEFPNVKGHLSENEIKALFPNAVHISAPENAVHIFTHKEWLMQIREVTLSFCDERYLFVTKKEIDALYAVPGAFQAALKQLK